MLRDVPLLPFLGRSSDALRDVMRNAHGHAFNERTRLIDTGHLLLALADRPEVAALLETVNASPAAVRRLLDATPLEPRPDRPEGRLSRHGATAPAEALLCSAMQRAGAPRRVTVANLLVAACRLPDSRAGSVLAELELQADDVRIFFEQRPQAR
jgi:ATP-dependent Clp protease ATP-binding subunit ClpA